MNSTLHSYPGLCWAGVGRQGGRSTRRRTPLAGRRASCPRHRVPDGGSFECLFSSAATVGICFVISPSSRPIRSAHQSRATGRGPNRLHASSATIHPRKCSIGQAGHRCCRNVPRRTICDRASKSIWSEPTITHRSRAGVEKSAPPSNLHVPVVSIMTILRRSAHHAPPARLERNLSL
jgi:hypothetical protein